MIEIVRAQNAEEIIKYLDLDDDRVEEYIVGTKLEWIQYMISIVEKEWVAIFSTYIDGELEAYTVVMDTVDPPITDYITVTYASNIHDLVDGEGNHVMPVLIDEIKKWGMTKKAKKINIFTNFPHICGKYGFKEHKKFRRMEMDI